MANPDESRDLAPPDSKKHQTVTSASGDDSLFAGVMEHAPVGMVLLSGDLHILYANVASFQLLAARDGSVLDQVHPDDRETLRFQLARQRLSARSVSGLEIRILQPGREARWTLVGISSVNPPCLGAEFMLSLTDRVPRCWRMPLPIPFCTMFPVIDDDVTTSVPSCWLMPPPLPMGAMATLPVIVESSTARVPWCW